ncbi:MAG: transcriptional repressor [Clostridiales bacterium]|nr:MAG: transcriptional repressor [Clostridiales bacterium]
MKKREVYDKLKRHALKRTSQRDAIIDVLLSNQDRLVTVEDIMAALQAADNNLNITTIYRNLEALERADLLHRTVLEDQMTYFKLSCDCGHHHHLICRRCGKIEIIDYCPLQSIYPITRARGFFIEGHKLEVYGICRDCLTAQPTERE